MFLRKLSIAATVLSLVTMIATTGAHAQDRRVTIVNNSGYTIVQFYASHRDAPTWEEDIWGNDVLPSGSSFRVNFDDGTGYCIFDFKAVFDDGEVLVDRHLNVCELSTFTYR
ncbi:hypothetical protein [Aliiroseovarius sp.]|uniref:hypothetical protein n=1 Tax=Aliiroseovarius sp. TaxID=1872442 RepID=UPI003BA951D4